MMRKEEEGSTMIHQRSRNKHYKNAIKSSFVYCVLLCLVLYSFLSSFRPLYYDTIIELDGALYAWIRLFERTRRERHVYELNDCTSTTV